MFNYFILAVRSKGQKVLTRRYPGLTAIVLVAVLIMTGIAPAHRSPASAQSAPFVNVEWYRESLIKSADLWNGGLDGESGMRAYNDDFTGYFHVSMDRQWNPTPMRSTTSVAQSRSIYMNIEAYRVAGSENGQRFLKAAEMGIDFLLANFRDSDYGGFYWEVEESGEIVNDMKQGYGNMHPMLALAQAYSVTGNPDYLDAALGQLDVIQEYFLDPDYPGGVLPGFDRTFSEIQGVKNIDTFTHLFEPLLILYDVTEGEQQDEIVDLINLLGTFLAEQLYNDRDAFTDRGYVAYNYTDTWEPSQEPYSRKTQWTVARQASTGHNIELAYLISRAVERNFNPEWLDVAEKLIRFCLEYTINPNTGGMLYEVTDYDGSPLEGNPDSDFYIYWAQAETARALLHFTVVRGDDYGVQFKAVEALFNSYMTDQEYGGLYHGVDTNLKPYGIEKGDIWKTNYHYTMFFAEVLRHKDYPSL
jgi:mannobiose 2-epimerase